MNLLHRHSLWLALPVGAALSLAFAPFNVWPLVILCPAFLFFAWDGVDRKRAAKIGFLFSSGTFLAGTYWLYHSVYVIGKAPLPIAILLMLGLVAIMGAYTALLGYAQARWMPRNGWLRYLIALPATWTLVEWLRGWLFSGFPWLSLGYAGMDTWIAAFAPIGGVYTLSALFALMAGATALAILSFYPTVRSEPVEEFRTRNAETNTAQTTLIACSIALIAPWLIAYSLKSHEWTQPIGAPVSAAIVQGSVPQEMKWTKEQHDATLKLYRDLTVPHWGAQLIIWPESALPDWAESLTDYLSSLWQDAALHRSDLVIGQIHYDVKADAAYNGVLTLSDQVQWYNKRHLVPFGEYFPVPSFVREWMRLMSLPHSDFTPGAADQPAVRAAGNKLGITVCYEDAYGSSMLNVLKEATILVNVTNDAWFGDSTARHQHLQIARMRALEAGRPLLRAANDGISGIIDARGQLLNQLPSFKSAVLTGNVQPRTGLTPYAKWGNWPIISLIVVLCIIAALRVARLAKRNISTAKEK